MKTYDQGKLDSLCGVYSIVHAAKKINGLTNEQCKNLFANIIRQLNKRGKLAEAIINGTDTADLKYILNKSPDLQNLGYVLLYEKVRINPSLDDFWGTLRWYKNKLGKNGAILLSLSKKDEHWTVLKSITMNQIKLYDSSKVTSILRNNCSTDKNARHSRILCANETFFIFNEKINLDSIDVQV